MMVLTVVAILTGTIAERTDHMQEDVGETPSEIAEADTQVRVTHVLIT